MTYHSGFDDLESSGSDSPRCTFSDLPVLDVANEHLWELPDVKVACSAVAQLQDQ